ncbi:MAG: gamma carbonic anhydrase family protein [Gemmatimonadetes bacterium]|nr:gamma carbonic anhydrase family protein [Gemmatimonadota bacterium]
MTESGSEFGQPTIDPGAWVAPGATVVGDVEIGADSSIWYGCVLRGDNDRIVIGRATNIQDLTMVHVDAGVPCRIGDRVSVGHRAILHGCTVMDGALIGMGAILLNGAVVEAGAIVAAGALVPEGRVIPAGMLAVGSPARATRPVDELLAGRREGTWSHYVEQARRHARMWKNIHSG